MNKKDLPILILLVALLLGWPAIYKRFFHEPAPPPEETVETAPSTTVGPVVTPVLAAPEDAPMGEEATPAPQDDAPAMAPAKTVVLTDDRVDITLSSHGATVTEAVLKGYRESVDQDSGPVILDFAGSPALAYAGLPGLGAGHDFVMEQAADGREVRFERTTAAGLRLRRTIVLEEDYVLRVTDEFTQMGAEPKVMPSCHIGLAPMVKPAAQARAMRGMFYLGVDTLIQAGEGVKHWGKKMPGWFKKSPDSDVVTFDLKTAADWVAVKNKFFVQILTPEGGMDDCVMQAERDSETKEIIAVAARAELPALTLAPGEPFVREYAYYAGPKKYSILRGFGQHKTKIMELGWFGSIGTILLRVLNFIYAHLWPFNYGLAIMLLTILIRVAFWPLTHKGTESMKRMQALQPEMKEIREKYKDNSQKQQQAMMALYKEHKVNPMMGCLPMLIQIPVFISLFYVLRSSIELRFAEFLWVRDLSEPENLISFGFTIPLLGWEALNILPLLMAATTLLQQKLTPTAGDPNQQKIMMFMPLIMLFFLYNFASGLVLYWTTNNVLMIVQQLMQRRRAKKK